MNVNTELSAWLARNLQELLSCLVSEDIIRCIMNIENDRDLEDYMSTLTNTSDVKYKKFLSNYKKIRCLRDDGEDDDFFNFKPKHNKKGSTDGSVKEKKSSSNVISASSETGTDKDKTGKKKKTKFINLYSPEGELKDVILLKGRHPCECQASKHKLVNNCLKCGRIVCEQEGSGPCMFCHLMVIGREEQNIINSNNKLSRKLYETIKEQQNSEELEKALERRDRLLDYDKSAAQRTKVIDDEGEYFSSTSVWLSKEERERLKKKEAEAHAKRHSSRLEKKFTFDFAGRTVVEEAAPEFGEDYYAEALSKIEESLAVSYPNPDVSLTVQPLYQRLEDGSKSRRGNFPKLSSDKMQSYRVQDKELLEMSDNGVCLSVHQPWASLLVHGIMRFEGRPWYTAHRGRLWIAATSKRASEDEIKDAERFFKQIWNDEDLCFPSHYPASCLLGCVSITDCMPQEEYRLKFPDGECDSPFVFICEDPRSLDIFFPITGSHKIYKLDSKIHQAANKALLRLAKKSKQDM